MRINKVKILKQTEVVMLSTSSCHDQDLSLITQFFLFYILKLFNIGIFVFQFLSNIGHRQNPVLFGYHNSDV